MVMRVVDPADHAKSRLLDRAGTCQTTGGWRLEAGGWWLVAGGWRLVAGGTGGWWLAAGGERRD
jgi:hypothetical protein